MGPLAGIRIVEFVNAAPSTFCSSLLFDLGAEIIQVDRSANRARGGVTVGVKSRNPTFDAGLRLEVDLKDGAGREAVLTLVEKADILIEGFRPGVMERLGLGPTDCEQRNDRLIYGRMTGWGQSGPLAQSAGHDISYIALSGVLHAIGNAGGPPAIPLTLVGDFGGGGLLLAFGLVAALVERSVSGRGQVVDAAMVDGAAKLMTTFYALGQRGDWTPERGTNLLDGGAPFYNVYATADAAYVAVGALLPVYYAQLLVRLGFDDVDPGEQHNRDAWPRLKQRFADSFRGKTRDEWCSLLEGSDVGFAPVLTMAEAFEHPHNRARSVFTESAAGFVPSPAPRFSRSIEGRTAMGDAGTSGSALLGRWGVSSSAISELTRGQGGPS